MRAAVGDQVEVTATHVDDPVRAGEVVEVRGANGEPPWVVRWSGSSEETLFYPGPDARVHSSPAPTD